MDKLNKLFPCIIGFEGPDGSGKSSMIAAFQKRFDELGIRNKIVSMIPESAERNLLLHGEDYTDRERLLLIGLCVSRAVKQIREAQNRGNVVLLDRTDISRRVYQGAVAGLNKEVAHLEVIIEPLQTLSHLVYCSVADEVAERRILERAAVLGKYDAFETVSYGYRQRVRDAYVHIMNEYMEKQESLEASGLPSVKVHYVSSEADPDTTATMILYEINDSLE